MPVPKPLLLSSLVCLSLLPGCVHTGQAPGAPGPAAAAADHLLEPAALRRDLRQLARLLDRSHPDPYRASGGRLAFHRKLHAIERAIPEQGLTAAGFLRRVRPLVAAVGDGHTTIRAPRAAASGRRLWVELDAASRRLFVSGVYARDDEIALGGRVIAVAGVAFAALVRRQQKLRGHDNAYNNLVHLMETLASERGLAAILGRAAPPERVPIRVATAGGGERTIRAVVAAEAPGELRTPPSRIALPPADAAGLGWGFMDAAHEVALLRIDSAMRYREAFEVWRACGFSHNLQAHLRQVARAAGGGRLPATRDAQIAAVPAATETFGALFAAMRREQTSTLIVDLRRNSGGNSAIAGILAYHLYGEQGLRSTAGGYQIPRLSTLYFENNSALDREATLAERGIQLGDYDFSAADRWSRAKESPPPAPADAKSPIEDYALLPTFHRALEAGAITPYAPPRIIVLTAARTYSAGFDIAAALYKRGAEVIGVPSAQAGNCFIDSLAYELHHSHLTGSISYKRSLLFPDDPRTGELLQPHIELTYETWAAMRFDPNAAVTLALRSIRSLRELPDGDGLEKP